MSSKNGILLGALSYFMWGVLPIYWKLVKEVSALEILSHRILWSLAFLAPIIIFLKRWNRVTDIIKNRRSACFAVLSSFLIAANWGVYIWAVNAGYTLESSLGYFITPLLNVALGYLLLGERLRKPQWIAVSLGAGAVVYLSAQTGGFPWIALSLAISFALYGYVRKIASYGSIEGLMIETILLAPIAFGFLAYHSGGQLFSAPLNIQLYLVGAGVITAVPLLLFASAAKRLQLQTLGFLQYISPTLQFLIAVFIFHEPFNTASAVGFTLVWLATAIYLGELFYHSRRTLTARMPV